MLMAGAVHVKLDSQYSKDNLKTYTNWYEIFRRTLIIKTKKKEKERKGKKRLRYVFLSGVRPNNLY
jgi:hypothetical protein